ncbi:spore germination protein [Jeotgalibacillus sp. S-D1]|uniref:spore germination protein n=1 Tax=Jeotgalibacillus sp. S-D1 TaxID=2552189 RepID=UPI00105AAA6B|nr:spore germination protein [Jeotgalibacillus sp. S-D1]TDL32739.1 spore germination protein [Jeotgalibacillus sp. S-D1]
MKKRPSIKKRRTKNDVNSGISSVDQSNHESVECISSSLSMNIESIKKRTGHSPDIKFRKVDIGKNSGMKSVIVYVQGLVDEITVTDFIIESIMNSPRFSSEIMPQEAIGIISEEVVSMGGITTEEKWDSLYLSLLSGDTVIFVEGSNVALIASTQGGETRSIQESTTNTVVRGPKEGFTESITTNIAMVRRIINNPDLWVESMKIGSVTNTDVSIMYINGIAEKKIVGEIRSRLKKINIDSVLESGYIEQLIEDGTMTPFPTLHNTERPDVVAGTLLEGSIAIFVDGTPFVLLGPALFIQFFQSPEDYYNRFFIASATRFLRIFVFIISLIGPALYVAVTTFDQSMIPTQLLIMIAAQRESVPFPAIVEALIMEVMFEILREAGLRMPKAIGSTISIVGALVIGQAAVQAGIVSPAMVIIVSITAIASFATPSYSMAISARLLRFVFMISAATFGTYGIIMVFILVLVHLCSLRSFGVPYMSPLAPLIPSEVGDTVVRRPLSGRKARPKLTTADNKIREGEHQKPQAAKDTGMVNAFYQKRGKRGSK